MFSTKPLTGSEPATLGLEVLRAIQLRHIVSDKTYKYILSSKFFEQSDEIIFRSIIDLLKKVSSKYYPPRAKSVKELILAINLNNQLKTTLGGCLIEKVNRTVIISPEKPQKKQN